MTDSTALTATSAAVTISVTVPPLVASTTGTTPTSGLAPLTVGFNGSASGGTPGYTYAWDFGDGSTPQTGLTSPALSYTYALMGTYTATLTVTDSTAKTATATVTISVNPPVPQVSLVSPPFGPETGGTSVTISGTYLESASSVKFGTKAATFSAPVCDASANCTITATAPASAAGNVNITVMTPGGSSPAGSSQYTYDLAWTEKVTAGPPTGRYGAAAAGDGTSFVLLFGGATSTGDVNETWTWNGSAWTAGTSPSGLGARSDAAAVYDSTDKVVVLFGGSTGGADLNDTWTWNPTTQAWTQVQANTASPGPNQPSQRTGASLFMDSTGHVVLFGGYNGSYLNDTWTFSFTKGRWTQVNASNCASTSLPACRAYAAASRDASGQGVLFGGTNGGYLGDTWTWNGSSWSAYTLASPTARAKAAMGYYKNPGGGTATGLMLFGGTNGAALGDTWTWSGGRWQEIYGTGSAGSPAARYGASAATDLSGGVLLVGGTDGTAFDADSWLLK